jgi:hypothetical protein
MISSEYAITVNGSPSESKKGYSSSARLEN